MNLKNNIALLLYVFSLTFSSHSYSFDGAVIGPVELDNNPNKLHDIPSVLTQSNHVLVSRHAYLISFNENTKLLDWALWKVDSNSFGDIPRANSFDLDPELLKYEKNNSNALVTSQTYSGSCFDRGHQVPSADRDSDESLNSETFLMTNVIPQTAYVNRVIWERLERYTRFLAIRKNKVIYVVAGPIYKDDIGYLKNTKLKIPSHNFKVLYIYDKDANIEVAQPEVVSVVVPNILENGKMANTNNNQLCQDFKTIGNTKGADGKPVLSIDDSVWRKFETPVNEIESMAKIKLAH